MAYTITPPIGGNHDQAWAACNGVVYPQPVRSENLVHSLEHGAVWIAYDPERVDDAAVDALAARVEGHPYMVLSRIGGRGTPRGLARAHPVHDRALLHVVAAATARTYIPQRSTGP